MCPHEWAAMLIAVLTGVGGVVVAMLAQLFDMFASKVISKLSDNLAMILEGCMEVLAAGLQALGSAIDFPLSPASFVGNTPFPVGL
jgi:hypothetical protein